MVGVTGFEPAASTSQTSRATNCATPRCPFVLLIIADFLPAVKGRGEKIPLRAWEILFSWLGAVLGVGQGGKNPPSCLGNPFLAAGPLLMGQVEKIPSVLGKSFSRGGGLLLAGQGGKNPSRAFLCILSGEMADTKFRQRTCFLCRFVL